MIRVVSRFVIGAVLATTLASGSVRADDIIAECWEHEDAIRAAHEFADDNQFEYALAATGGFDFAQMDVDCHSNVREFRARIYMRRGQRDQALDEYREIFDRDPQWRSVSATPSEDGFVDAIRSQWLQENPIGLRVTPRSIDLASAPPGGIELELTHDPRFVLRWRVRNRPGWVDVTKNGGRTVNGAASTRVVVRKPGEFGPPGVIELECKPWAEVQVPVFGTEGPVAGGRVATDPDVELTTLSRRSGPPMWLRILGGLAVAGGASYVAVEIINGGNDPSDPIDPNPQLPEPPDPPTDEPRAMFRWRF